jgi:hypothetical protein
VTTAVRSEAMLVSDASGSQDQPLSSLLSPLVAASRRGGAWLVNSLEGAVRGLVHPIGCLRAGHFLKQRSAPERGLKPANTSYYRFKATIFRKTVGVSGCRATMAVSAPLAAMIG